MVCSVDASATAVIGMSPHIPKNGSVRSPCTRTRAPRLALSAVAVLAVAAVAGCGSSPARGPIDLDSIILRPSQVGAGFVEHPYQDARTVSGQVTLDLCGFSFQSESLRTARFEVAYVKPGDKVGVSNEVVRYRAGGARAAMEELNRAANRCPTSPVSGPVAGVGPITYHLFRISGSGLLTGALALRVDQHGIVNGRRIHAITFVIYQTKGDVLSAVYGIGPSAAATEPLALHAAQQSAHNLSSSA